MVWGGGDGGQGRANLERWESVRDDVLRKEENRGDDSDGNDDESIKNRNREDSINRLVVIMIVAFFIGLIGYLVVFFLH
jgi:hypothetical protein